MRKVCVLFSLSMFCSLIVLSCAGVSARKIQETDGMMYGMIYDRDNNPMSDVSLFIDGDYAVNSDIQGRFILDFRKKQECEIQLKKKGYEDIRTTVRFNAMSMLYFKMSSAAQLLVEAETALDSRDYELALGCAARALSIEPFRTDGRFLQVIILMEMKEYEKALESLEKVEADGRSEIYIQLTQKKIEELMNEKK